MQPIKWGEECYVIDEEKRNTMEVLRYYASLTQEQKSVVSESHLEYLFDLKVTV